MRLRNVRGAGDIIAADQRVIKEPKLNKGRWSEVFKNSNPIQIEIGMGKGKFILEKARLNSNINYIGIEMYSSVLIRALERCGDEVLNNLFFLCIDARELDEVFGADEVERIYLNFSDPWPKDRHAKRRLTSKQFLARYDTFLKADGQIEFKTDNDALFEFSLSEIKKQDWSLRDVTYDLHGSIFVRDNVMTEYEEKFSSQGNLIHRLVAYRTKGIGHRQA